MQPWPLFAVSRFWHPAQKNLATFTRRSLPYGMRDYGFRLWASHSLSMDQWELHIPSTHWIITATSTHAVSALVTLCFVVLVVSYATKAYIIIVLCRKKPSKLNICNPIFLKGWTAPETTEIWTHNCSCYNIFFPFFYADTFDISLLLIVCALR